MRQRAGASLPLVPVGVHRRALVLLCSLAIACAALLHTVATSVRADGPSISGSTTGEIGCSDVPPLQPAGCPSWEESSEPGQAEWHAVGDKALTVAGIANAGTFDVGFVKQDLPDGSLGSVTLTARLEVSLTGGGRASALANFSSSELLVNASSVSVVGSVTADSTGSDQVNTSTDSHVELTCFAATGNIDDMLTTSAGAGEPAHVPPITISGPKSRWVRRRDRVCAEIDVQLVVSGGTIRQVAGTEGGTSSIELSLTILAAGPAPTSSAVTCAVGGSVVDGTLAADGHADPAHRYRNRGPRERFRRRPARGDRRPRQVLRAGWRAPGGGLPDPGEPPRRRARTIDLPHPSTRPTPSPPP